MRYFSKSLTDKSDFLEDNRMRHIGSCEVLMSRTGVISLAEYIIFIPLFILIGDPKAIETVIECLLNYWGNDSRLVSLCAQF